MTSDQWRLLVRAALLIVPIAAIIVIGYREEKRS